MKKEYSKPQSITTEIFIEGTILSMSINGEVNGPAGSSHITGEEDWEEESTDSWY